MPPRVLVVTGPTATGKTALGVELALALGGEVVSADSMQLYRRMDIGTAKPTKEEMRGVPHHMIDVADPGESYSAARFCRDAARCTDDIISRGRLPIIVGGTGLYIDSLVSGRDFADEPGDTGLREKLSGEYDAVGGEAMLSRLRSFDPDRAAKLHPGDRRRIVRAIEVYELTGETITAHDERTKAMPPRYDAVKLALSFRDRRKLYDRIDRRVDLMMESGLVREVQSLLDSGIGPDTTAMQAIGYKEIAQALRGEITMEQAVDTVKRESRRYAKRQLTWLRRDKTVFWLEWENEPGLDFARRHSTDFLSAHGIEW